MPLHEDDVISLAKAQGIRATAISDALIAFPNNDKISFAEWFASVKAKKPHWLEPEPAVAGDECTSITAQVAYVRKHGEVAAAAHLAQFGLKLGIVKKPEASTSRTNAGDKDKDESTATNPWSPKFKGTKEAAAKRRLEVIKMDTAMARRLAAKAGCRVDGGPLL